MIKREGWQTRLEAFIESRRSMPFKWGTNDCCQFAAQAIYAMAGFVDIPQLITAHFSGYETKKEAIETARLITGEKLYARCIKKLPEQAGFKPIDPKTAQRGDLVMIKLRCEAPGIGVVSLDGRYAVAPGLHGLMRFPVLSAKAAWRVD